MWSQNSQSTPHIYKCHMYHKKIQELRLQPLRRTMNDDMNLHFHILQQSMHESILPMPSRVCPNYEVAGPTGMFTTPTGLYIISAAISHLAQSQLSLKHPQFYH